MGGIGAISEQSASATFTGRGGDGLRLCPLHGRPGLLQSAAGPIRALLPVRDLACAVLHGGDGGLGLRLDALAITSPAAAGSRAARGERHTRSPRNQPSRPTVRKVDDPSAPTRGGIGRMRLPRIRCQRRAFAGICAVTLPAAACGHAEVAHTRAESQMSSSASVATPPPSVVAAATVAPASAVPGSASSASASSATVRVTWSALSKFTPRYPAERAPTWY